VFGWKKAAKKAGREAARADATKLRPQIAKNGPIPPPDATLLSEGELVIPEIIAPYSQQAPSFEGVGDTMGFGESYFGTPTCAWCGSPGAHKADCKALARNYGEERGSLGRQRTTTEALRQEVLTRSFPGDRTPVPTTTRERKVDTRTELQKRFDEIAAELAETKDGE